MKKYYFFILSFSFCIFTGCTIQREQSNEQIVSEAQAFMEGYAKDLRAKDGTAVAARYHKSGAYILGNGHKMYAPYDSIQVRYTERWRGPDSFEWQDLTFESIGANTILVLGKFLWGNDNFDEPATFSYAGLLKRQDGELRIRAEDESVDPMSMKEFICKPDTTAE